MSPGVRPVTVVTVHGQEIRYDWATSVTVTRSGDLKVWQGWRQRVFHPRGEWARYTVDAGSPLQQPVAGPVIT